IVAFQRTTIVPRKLADRPQRYEEKYDCDTVECRVCDGRQFPHFQHDSRDNRKNDQGKRQRTHHREAAIDPAVEATEKLHVVEDAENPDACDHRSQSVKPPSDQGNGTVDPRGHAQGHQERRQDVVKTCVVQVPSHDCEDCRRCKKKGMQWPCPVPDPPRTPVGSGTPFGLHLLLPLHRSTPPSATRPVAPAATYMKNL